MQKPPPRVETSIAIAAMHARSFGVLGFPWSRQLPLKFRNESADVGWLQVASTASAAAVRAIIPQVIDRLFLLAMNAKYNQKLTAALTQ